MADVFPERLRKLIERKGVGKHIIAEHCALSGSMMGKYERGERSPTAEVIKNMAIYFDVTSDYLLGLSDDPWKKE